MATPPSAPIGEDRFYSPKKMLKWFGITSILMLLFTIWMIMDDFGREWKGFQREFASLQQKKFDEWIEAQKEDLDGDEIDEIQNAIGETEKGIVAKSKQIEKQNEELVKLQTKEKIAIVAYQVAKGEWDVQRYHYEAKFGHYIAEDNLAEKKKGAERKSYEALAKEAAHVSDLQMKANAISNQVIASEKAIKAHYSEKVSLNKKLAKARGKLDLLEENKEAGKFSLTKLIRSSPIIDLANPVFRVKQIVLPQIRDDIEFAKIQKVDRCTTCHQSIDQPGFENEANPHKTHPRLDVMLGSRSPHPINSIGCTICHSGRGRAVDFTRAAHTPQDEAQAKVWKKKYGWHEMHHVPEKMLPLQYTQGSCVVCHLETEHVPRATKLNSSIQNFRSSGCYGCHKVAGWEHIRKPGPSLKKINGKVTRDWMVKWVRNPYAFNEKTRMPRVFGLPNMEKPEFQAYQEAEIHALVDYIRSMSETYQPNHRVALGSVEAGKKLFGEVGCLGCHNIDDYALDNDSRFNRAPDLSTVGSKISKDWLTSWLKNPKHYWAETSMPSLRLSDSEIGKLSAYLLSKKNADFEQLPVGEANLEMQKEVLRKYLIRDPKLSPATPEKVEKVISELSPEQVSLELGKRTNGRMGCYGCHEMKGWEKTEGIGTELSDWGNKQIKKLDFGLLPVAKSRHAWATQKLKHPRSFDKGLVREYLDTLRMPQFNFTDAEVNKHILFLLGRTGQEIKPEVAKVLDAHEQKVEQAHRVIHKYNCQGCHVAEKMFESMPEDHPDFDTHEEGRFLMEGRILRHYEDDETLGPPWITEQGKKVLSDWAYRFMTKPFPLRRLLKVRMPSFNMAHKELNTLVEGWANEGDGQFPVVKPQKAHLSGDKLVQARKLFQRLRCTNCHTVGEQVSLAELEGGSRGVAPDLTLSAKRLHRSWIVAWLKDPAKIYPGTRMPGFWPGGASPAPDILGGDSEKQIELMADYVIYLGQNRKAE